MLSAIDQEIDIAENKALGDITDIASSPTGEGILGIGIFVIIATPLIRILTTAILFSRERDMFLAIISLIVLAIIAIGFIQGIA